MKHFTLAIVLLAVFVSVALADRPSLKKKPVEPVPESVEEEELEQPAPKKPLRPSLKEKPASQEDLSEEEPPKQLSKKPVRPAVNKKPAADEIELKEESSSEQSDEVKEEIPEKKSLKQDAKKPLVAADLGIQPPENLVKAEEPLDLEPPSVISKKKPPKPALLKQ